MSPTPEQQARTEIDRLLAAAGWSVQDVAQANIHASRGVALREFPLNSGFGFADYLLYIDGKAAGVIEAKKEGATLTGVEIQSSRYAKGLPVSLPAWRHPLPFQYESTGVETHFTSGLDPQKRVPAAFLERSKIPLPYIEEQRRIVSEIEKQFSRLDEAVANLKRVRINLKRYRASVLKAAVEGRLVPTEAELARHDGRCYETGAQLLRRILEMRCRQWKGKGKYQESSPEETADLPTLPAGWSRVRLDAVASIKGGITVDKKRRDHTSRSVPVPPAAEQSRIVAEVERRLSLVREVERELEVNLKRAQGLRQAVLAQQFSVDTDRAVEGTQS